MGVRRSLEAVAWGLVPQPDLPPPVEKGWNTQLVHGLLIRESAVIRESSMVLLPRLGMCWDVLEEGE